MERQPREQRPRSSRSTTTRVRSEFDAIRIDRNQRKFSRDEESVEEDEKNNSEKTERGGDEGSLLSPFSGVAACPGPPAPMTMLKFERRAEACRESVR